MKSKAAIGNHPIHPMLIPIPIGAFVLALIGDLATTATGNIFWYDFAYYCIGIGVISGLLAAVFGLVDYLGVEMTARARRMATIHMLLNVVAVVLYAVNFFLRRDNAAFQTARWTGVMILEVATLLGLAVSGWIGGQLAYIHHVGVVEDQNVHETDTGRRAA
jgi:uncharacterized membrane protein